LSADNTQTQEKLFYQILKGGISVRDLEKKVRATSRKKKTIDPFVLETEGSLQKILGTKVKIYNKRNNQGKIVIEYYTLNDFERIIKRFK